MFFLCLSSSHINDNRYRLEVLLCYMPDSLALVDRLKLVLYSRDDCSTIAVFQKCSGFSLLAAGPFINGICISALPLNMLLNLLMLQKSTLLLKFSYVVCHYKRELQTETHSFIVDVIVDKRSRKDYPKRPACRS